MVEFLALKISHLKDLEKISLAFNKLTASGICQIIDACSQTTVKSLQLNNQTKPLGHAGEAKVVEKILSKKGYLIFVRS